MTEKPNIVLIMTDEMRGDCMGIAGHPDVKTPYLDSLAAKGIYYRHAVSACPSCVPARACLHTGLSQVHTGRVGYQDCVDWNYDCTMAGELAKAGYYTQCVGKMHVHPLRNCLGFHNVELHDGYLHAYRTPTTPACEFQDTADDYLYWLKQELGVRITDTGLDCNGWVARPWPFEEKYHPTNWVAERSVDFLRRRDPRKPFFLMASFVRPHAPYDAPEEFFRMYRDKDLRPPVYGDWDDREQLEKTGRIYSNNTGPVDPELIRQQMIGYYACISHVDNQIGRILLALVENKLSENTVVVFVSDHGEMLSDHCMNRKSLPYQGSMHIPMIISGPERIIGRKDVQDDSLVELRDIMPTLLSLAGAEIPEGLDGVNVLNGTDRKYLHGEHPAEKKSNHFIVTPWDKYIWFSQTGEEQYFDLVRDPGEKRNAIADSACQSRIGELRNILIRELAGRPEGYSDGSKLIAGRKTVNVLPGVGV